MLKKIIFVLLFSPLAFGQLTQVSGTIKDPTGLPYANGTIAATLVISGTPRFSFNSLPYTPPSAPVGLDSTGSFVMSLGDVNQLTPSGGTWSFHVCSAQGTVQPGSPITHGPVCFDAPGFIITGAAVNISSQLSLAAPPLTNLTTGGSGTVGPGTVGQYAIYTGSTTVGSTPNLGESGGAIQAKLPLFINNNGTGPTLSVTNTTLGGTLFALSGGVSNTTNFVAANPTLGVGTGAISITGQLNVPALTANLFSPPSQLTLTPLAGINLLAANSAGALSYSQNGGAFQPVQVGPVTVPLSSLTNATASNTINNGDLQQTWNWALTGDVPGLQIAETPANTNTTTPLVNIATQLGSFTTPLQLSQGTLNTTVVVPALNINTTLNSAGLADNIFQINAVNTASTNSNFFAFNGGAAGATLFSKLDLTGTFYLAGPILSNNATNSLRICAVNISTCTAPNAGPGGTFTAQGGDNSSNSAAARGGAGIFRGGMLTNATPNAAAMEGTVQLGGGMMGTSAAAFNTVCQTTTGYVVADCSATGPQANVIGISTSTVNPIGVVVEGSVPVNLDNTGVIGDFVCRGTVAAGQNHDNGTTPCAAGLGIGVVIQVAGTVNTMTGNTVNSTATLSTSSPLVMLHIR